MDETIARNYTYSGGMDFDSVMSGYPLAFSKRRRTHPVVWGNFVVSVWLLIGLCAFMAVRYYVHASEVVEAYHPYSPRFVAWPFVTGFMELLFWFRFFKERERGSRLFSGLVGIMMLLKQGLVPLIVIDLYGYTLNKPEFLFFLYVAISHLCFTVWGREEG